MKIWNCIWYYPSMCRWRKWINVPCFVTALCRPDGLYHTEVIQYPDKWSSGIPLKGDYHMSQSSPWAHWCICTILTKNSCIHSHYEQSFPIPHYCRTSSLASVASAAQTNGLSESVSLQHDNATPSPHTHTHTLYMPDATVVAVVFSRCLGTIHPLFWDRFICACGLWKKYWYLSGMTELHVRFHWLCI